MKIVLTTSPREDEAISNTNPRYVLRDFIKYPPLALLSILRNVDKKHEIVIFDANEYSFDGLANNILKEKPDLVGISATTECFYGILKLALAIKSSLLTAKTIIGGAHADLYPEETMTHSEFDFLLNGPCEFTFPLFVDWLDNKKGISVNDIDNFFYRDGDIVKFTRQKRVQQLDGYPFPDRTRIDLKKYTSLSDRKKMTTMNSSRGCPFRCIFCNVPRYYLTRSAPYVVDEIEEILELGFNEIHILDDTFNINRQRVLEICNLIKKRNLKFRWSTRARLNPFDDEIASAMKESGCFRLNVGVESHNPKILDYINKKVSRDDIVKGFEIIRKYKLETMAFFIIGYPEQTVDDVMETTSFIKEIKPTFILLNTLIALPFSDFYFELLKKGIYQEDYWRNFVLNPVPNFMLPSWRGEEMDRVLLNIRDDMMKRFYLSPSFVAGEVINDLAHFDFEKLGRKIKIGLDMAFNKLKT